MELLVNTLVAEIRKLELYWNIGQKQSIDEIASKCVDIRMLLSTGNSSQKG